MARIYRRPESAIWQCQYKIPGNPKKVRESTGCIEKAAAQRFLEARIRETGFKKIVGPAADRVKFADLVKLGRDDARNSGNRMRDFEYNVKRLSRRFGHHRVIEISGPEIVAYTADELADGYAPSTVDKQLSTLRHLFNLGVRHELIATVPYIKLIRAENSRTVLFTKAEYVALREAIGSECSNFIDAEFYSGIRRTEMARLEWRDVYPERGMVTFRGITTKNGEPHCVPLAGKFGAAIEQARERRRMDCRHVFHINGKPLVYVDGSLSAAFRKAWYDALHKCGLEGRWLHDFRRSATTDMYDSGMEEGEIKQVTGHLSDVVRRYRLFNRDRVAASMERRDAYLETQPTERKVEKL